MCTEDFYSAGQANVDDSRLTKLAAPIKDLVAKDVCF
jgi:hypothetical protein